MGIILISGCIQQEDSKAGIRQIAATKCVKICQTSYEDLESGPCLSDDHPDWDIDDWVCDVAHSPREDVDNLPENQCQEFRDGEAHHFVEVDPNCEFIKAV